MNGTQTQTQPSQGATQQQQPTDFEKLLQKPHESREMTFVPFGQTDRIKLSVQVVQKLIAVRTRSGSTCSDRDALRFMMMCQAQRLNPFQGDAFLIGYDTKDGPQFSLITAHQAFLKRAELHPEYDGMKSGVIVQEQDGPLTELEGDFHLPNQEVVGGWATVFFKTRKVATTRRIRLARFKKSFGVWQDDPAGMICKCAEADALRSSFPTLLGGLYLRDEIDLKLETNVAVELPTKGLVEVTGAPHRSDNDDGDLGPQKPRSEANGEAATEQPDKTETPQQQLANVVQSWGYSFDVFRRWCEEGGSLENASSLASYDDIPKADAERLLKSFRGARAGATIRELMEKIKGGLL